MKEIRKYEAFDGEIFDTETECINYENQFEEIKKAREAVKTIMSYCASHETSCSSCIFNDPEQGECMFFSSSVPEEWTVASGIKIN